MKQHITIEDWEQLSVVQKEKLLQYWNPKKGDRAFDTRAADEKHREGFIEYKSEAKDGTFYYFSALTWSSTQPKEDFVPLFSIGQLIEFLDKKDVFSYLYIDNGWSKNYETDEFALGWTGELCDGLWSEVKDCLKK